MTKNEQEKNNQKEPDRHRTERASFWGIVGGGLIGIVGFGVSGLSIFIFSPFVLGLVGFIGGFVVDKIVEIRKNRKIFKINN